ncbi:hypothetical protein KAK07_04750 [Ideonella sp. 4Y16]|uniref:Uncharacterized protein n=1 Tax=Ideonella alba TaxID=2824118 RepID=A0A941BHQ4_9BURK|nr:hypothetical protein [Ideonella alba]MBQ0931878.1 hypothetical protein [Ideonella alba]MBQ0942636.1 hypothetical protein [Ideonella alba]
MTSTPKTPNKIPRPPQSTLDLKTQADHLRLKLSVAFTGQADRDVAAVMAVQLEALAELARIGQTHATDAELKALVQRVQQSSSTDEQQLRALKQRLPKA